MHRAVERLETRHGNFLRSFLEVCRLQGRLDHEPGKGYANTRLAIAHLSTSGQAPNIIIYP